MKNIVTILATLLLLMGTAPLYGDATHLQACRAFYGKLHDLKLRQSPKRVLLIPLLSRDPHTTEKPRWSEQPARILKAYYRNRFGAKVEVLHDIWSWSDYYPQIERLAQDSPPFDRVVFISHGGFDGPVLKNSVFWQHHEAEGNKGELLQHSEAQPGLLNTMSIVYDPEKNAVFSDYMIAHLQDFESMKSGEVYQRLKELEMRLQPLDRACFDRYCAPDKLAASPERVRPHRIELCERTCRESLFRQQNGAELSAQRFLRFAQSLRAVTAENGLIFFGTCNPGSAAPKKEPDEQDKTELLINSNLAGGPHATYVHLISAATGRIAAGPIGQSSAEDIVKRVMLFENNRPQRHLCIALPSAE